MVETLPLAPGTFHDKDFRRVINYRKQFPLPYATAYPLEGDEGDNLWGNTAKRLHLTVERQIKVGVRGLGESSTTALRGIATNPMAR